MTSRSGSGLGHYGRFVSKFGSIKKLRNEPLTVILSPHMDDAFLSLDSFLRSGKLGSSIVAVNVFTLTDSEVRTNVRTDFNSMMSTSAKRMREELTYSEYLSDSGISYMPVFLGFKDAAVDTYYRFIAGKKINSLPKGIGSVARVNHMIYVSKLYDRLGIEGSLVPIIRQLGHVNKLLAPIGIGDHIDHMLLRRFVDKAGNGLGVSIGYYADIPYINEYGYDSIEKLRKVLPRAVHSHETMSFDPIKKTALFRKLYGSQYDSSIGKDIRAIARSTGEAIFWR